MIDTVRQIWRVENELSFFETFNNSIYRFNRDRLLQFVSELSICKKSKPQKWDKSTIWFDSTHLHVKLLNCAKYTKSFHKIENKEEKGMNVATVG